MALLLLLILVLMAVGSLFFAFNDTSVSARRIAALRQSPLSASDETAAPGRRKDVGAVLKGMELKEAGKKEKLTVRRRLDRAGFSETPARYFWFASAGLAASAALLSFFYGQSSLVAGLLSFASGVGLPRWVLGFLQRRREKKFTNDFANAIDVIVRSVKSGFPVNEALKVVAYEFRDPVSGEFRQLIESMKVGLSLDQGLRRMFDRMPTSEVAFFGIVMSVQQKSGGNLAEALSNLASVLRDRKRLEGKIKAMSSEAKASAMIIGSLPPVVMLLVYLTSPEYITLLFTERMGNVLLVICLFWMGVGIFVMKKMIDFKH